MTTLEWQSIEKMRVKLEIERLEMRFHQSLAEMALALRNENGALWTRWQDEGHACTEQLKPLRDRLLEYDNDPARLNAAIIRGHWELEELRRRDSRFVPRKKQLEIDLLRMQQHYDECMSALHSADDIRIAKAFGDSEADREKCIATITEFQRDYLGEITQSPEEDGPLKDFQPPA